MSRSGEGRHKRALAFRCHDDILDVSRKWYAFQFSVSQFRILFIYGKAWILGFENHAFFGKSSMQINEFATFSNLSYGGFSIPEEVMEKIHCWYKIPKTLRQYPRFDLETGTETMEEHLEPDVGNYPEKFHLHGLYDDCVRIYRPDKSDTWTVFTRDGHEVRISNDQEVIDVMCTGYDDPDHLSLDFFPIELLHSLRYSEYDGSESIRPCKYVFVFHRISNTQQGQALITEFEQAEKRVRHEADVFDILHVSK